MRSVTILACIALASCSDDGETAAGSGGKSSGSGGSGAASGWPGAGGSDGGAGGGSAGSSAGGSSAGAGGGCGPATPSLARVGATLEVPTLAETLPKRNPDVAHDPVHDVYLVVTGATAISGTFLDASGQSLSAPFAVAQTSAYTQTPRVIHGAGKLLVTWHDNRNSDTQPDLRARLVSWTGSAPDLGAADFQVGARSYWEMGSALAFSETSQQFLVVWQVNGENHIRARLIDTTGALIGSEISVADGPDWHSGAAAAWNSARNEFLVAYAHASSSGAAVSARRLGADGTLIGGEVELGSGSGTWTAAAAYLPCDDEYFVAWYSLPSNAFSGVRLGADAAPLGTVFTLAPGYGGYDSLTVTRHPRLGTLISAFHGQDDEDYGVAYLPTGEQTPVTRVTESPGEDGNFNPRIAASSLRNEWLLVTSRGFNTVVAQRLGP
jgi:hypothetical protein